MERIKEIYYWFWRLWNNKIKFFPKEVKWFIQRGRRGYADCDTWSFDSYLSKVISGGLKQLAERSYGCPESLYDESRKDDECHEWKRILFVMANEFEKYSDEIELPGNREYNFKGNTFEIIPPITDEEMEQYKKLTEEKDKKFDEAFVLFKKYYRNLWD